MAPSQKDLKILYQRSGNRCAYPHCRKTLTYEEGSYDTPIAISEVAHIVAQSLDGPRGSYPLPPNERDNYDNLILLCEEHHHIVDANPASYSVEMLRRWKSEHEKMIAEATSQALKEGGDREPRDDYSTEVIYSTLLPVVHMPKYVYAAPCKYGDTQEGQVRQETVYPKDGCMAPFIVRTGRLFCFNDLYRKSNPFRNVIDASQITKYRSREWWGDPDNERWFVQLLNRSLNKLTGRRGLNLDREHRRYYFQPENANETLKVSYQPLNQSTTERQVVWQPKSKCTGAGKGYWFHLAVALRFHHVSSDQWCLSIRPEMHISRDGLMPYPSEKIGRRVTQRVSRRFNYDLLGDIQFWRNFLSDNSPRILLLFGKKQYIEIANTLMQAEVSWPGMPEEHARPFKNVYLPETLFSLAEFDWLDHESEDDWEMDEDDEELGDQEEYFAWDG